VVDLRSCELLRGGRAPQAALFTNLDSKGYEAELSSEAQLLLHQENLMRND
jgi:hypothetical protein